MRNLLLLCVAFFGFGFAQAQDHTVLAGNYYYNPATLTVTAGETIEFLNEGGFHNVNGMSPTLSTETWTNPESFSLPSNSGSAPGVPMGTITLNTPGTYNYDCSIGNHAAQGMVGTIIVEAAATTTSNITFTVDIPSNLTVAADGMHIAGTMTSWQGEPMSDNGDGTWSKTYALEDGDVTFKFQNGLNGWESTPDRTYTVAGADAEYSACWETTLSECPGVVPVTFQVDMANAGLVGGEAITVAGSMTGWCGGCVVMTDDDADGVYTATMDLGMNSEFEFKYLINGYANEGGTEESLIGTACDWNPTDAFGNRGFATAEAPLTLDVVCFNYCGTCEEQNNGGGGDPAGPTDNAADPTQDASDVISIYSDAYADIATEYNPNWGQSGVCCVNTAFDPGTGNNVLYYQNFNYQGTNLPNTDASGMTHLHIDVWVEAGTDRQLKVTPVNAAPGGNQESLVNVPLTPGAWNSVDLAQAEFVGMTWENLIQMKFDGQFNGDGSANTTPFDIYLDNIYFYNDGSGDNGGGGDPGDGTALVSLTFDDAASVDSWQAVADATLPEASLAWNAAGVETGALEISGTNTADDAGRAYIFQYADGNVDYEGSTDVTLSFDIKAGSPLVGTAVHLQTEFPGAGTINTFDIQNSGINESGWTTLSYDFSGVSGDGIFRMQFNMAAGAFSGAGGTLLVDNISLTGSGSGGGGGPVETPTVSVTFNVNMANEQTSAQGVFLAGGADFGAPGTNALTDADGDDIWTITVEVDSNYTGYYTFTNGACADYSCKEDIEGQSCADPGNYNDRQLVAIVSDTTISTCFGECTTDGSCTPVVTGPDLVATLDASCSGITEITEVRISGPFWGWDPAGGPVAALNSEGLYEVVFSPAPDADMEYKWLINGTQEDLLDFSDEDLDGDGYNDFLNGDCVPITDYFSYANRQWTVGSGDIADTWSQCAPCETAECPLDSAMVTITVDMSEEEVNPIGVFVAGTFQGWTPGATLATDNGDGTWSHSFMAGVGDTVQYKWMNGTAWGFEEVVPSDCQYPGDSNRGFEVPCEDYSHPVHCYSSCNPCGAATYDVTFTVLTENIMVDAGGMYLAGAPTGWSPTAMSDNGDGSWSITLSLEVGSAEFKFQNGEGGWEELDCGGNRSVTVDGSGPVSYTGCFAQCGETTECTVDPDPANVTFRLDMSAEDSISTDGVFLTGSFTSPVWQAGAIAMDDADGDLIYEATVLISGPAGIAYKFFNGNPYPDNVSTEEGGETADFAAAGCGVDNGVGGFNRTHDRSGADETLDVVCFNSCSACGPEGTAVTFSVDMNSYGSAFRFS